MTSVFCRGLPRFGHTVRTGSPQTISTVRSVSRVAVARHAAGRQSQGLGPGGEPVSAGKSQWQLSKHMSSAENDGVIVNPINTHMKDVNVTGTGNGWKCVVRCGAHSIVTDEPKTVKGGHDLGPTPLHVALASLAGCTQATLESVSKGQGLEIGNVHYDIHGKWDARAWRGLRDDDGQPVPANFQHVLLHVQVETPGTQEQVDALAAVVRERCPIYAMMHKVAQMDERWERADPGTLEWHATKEKKEIVQPLTL